MPVIDGVGYNKNNTPHKQFALNDALRHIGGACCAASRNRDAPIYFGDMTAGPGMDPVQRQDGSPLIIAKHASYFIQRGYNVKMFCVERDARLLAHLRECMAMRYPDVPVTYFTDQLTALQSVPRNAGGFTYWDPNGYKELDHELLGQFGRSHYYLDILITRECFAGRRMLCAGVPGTLVMQEYLALTGKKCNYIMEFARHGWWSLGFADNWAGRPLNKMGGMCNVESAEGRELCRRWIEGGSSDTKPRLATVAPQAKEQSLW